MKGWRFSMRTVSLDADRFFVTSLRYFITILRKKNLSCRSRSVGSSSDWEKTVETRSRADGARASGSKGRCSMEREEPTRAREFARWAPSLSRARVKMELEKDREESERSAPSRNVDRNRPKELPPPSIRPGATVESQRSSLEPDRWIATGSRATVRNRRYGIETGGGRRGFPRRSKRGVVASERRASELRDANVLEGEEEEVEIPPPPPSSILFFVRKSRTFPLLIGCSFRFVEGNRVMHGNVGPTLSRNLGTS